MSATRDTSASELPPFLCSCLCMCVCMCVNGGRNSSVGSVLVSLSCMMQCHEFNPPELLVEGIFP